MLNIHLSQEKIRIIYILCSYFSENTLFSWIYTRKAQYGMKRHMDIQCL